MTEQELHNIINGCKKNDQKSQRELFAGMYNFGMSIASRYSNNIVETEEIANDGFYKMLKNIEKYNTKIPFTLWLRRVIINCGIDYYRKHIKNKPVSKHQRAIPTQIVYNDGEQSLQKAYLMDMIQKLSPQYKIVFVLYVVEDYTHSEISKKLNISIGTSKSNLSKARSKLKEMIRLNNKNIMN